MNILITLAVVGIIAIGAWDLRNGSLDIFSALSTNKYAPFLSQINAKNLSFKVLSPSYIPSGFKFLREDSMKMKVQNNIGIPQVNYLFETSDGKNGLALRQFDKTNYQKTMGEVLREQEGITDFQKFFETQYGATPIVRDNKTIYIKIPAEKVRSVFGDLQYIASAHLVNDDSIIELNYSGTVAFSQKELIKIILSLKPAL